MKTAFKVTPVIRGGGRYPVPTAQGTYQKAIAEAEKWILANRLEGEIYGFEIEFIPMDGSRGFSAKVGATPLMEAQA
jgi:hypothetical protein